MEEIKLKSNQARLATLLDLADFLAYELSDSTEYEYGKRMERFLNEVELIIREM